MKKKNELFTIIIIVLAFVASAFIFFTREPKPNPVFGTYRIYTTDPNILRHVINQDISLKLNENHTIAYNTTLNGKRFQDISGTFVLDEKTNTLTIAWLRGKLPKKLKVEKEGNDYIIRIGETMYKKEKDKTS